MGSFNFRFWQSTLGPRLTATQSAVAALDIALGDSAAGTCQQRRLQVDKSAVAVASGSRLNERSEATAILDAVCQQPIWAFMTSTIIMPATQPGMRNRDVRNARWQLGHQPICSLSLIELASIGWQQ
jgi:hypothetical protein